MSFIHAMPLLLLSIISSQITLRHALMLFDATLSCHYYFCRLFDEPPAPLFFISPPTTMLMRLLYLFIFAALRYLRFSPAATLRYFRCHALMPLFQMLTDAVFADDAATLL